MLRKIKYNDFINSSEAESVKSLINSPSNLFWDVTDNHPALLVSLEDNTNVILTDIPEPVFLFIKNLLIKEDYNLKQRNTLIEIKSNSNLSSSFIYTHDKENKLQKFFNPTDNIKCLISDRINLPIFLGHYSSIERLAEESDYKYSILSLGEVLAYE